MHRRSTSLSTKFEFEFFEFLSLQNSNELLGISQPSFNRKLFPSYGTEFSNPSRPTVSMFLSL